MIGRRTKPIQGPKRKEPQLLEVSHQFPTLSSQIVKAASQFLILPALYQIYISTTAAHLSCQHRSAMSCNICHTPILVDRRYLNLNEPNMITQTDHLEPIVGHVCPPKVHQPYFRKVVQLDYKFEGIVAKGLVHAGRGRFISSYWDIVGGMALYYQQEEVDSSGLTKSCVISLQRFDLTCSIMLHTRGV
jgi:hypothetical protein